ncbi:MAG: hypothetical protein ACU826_01620 [Gammaproteobacteria bacterium]
MAEPNPSRSLNRGMTGGCAIGTAVRLLESFARLFHRTGAVADRTQIMDCILFGKMGTVCGMNDMVAVYTGVNFDVKLCHSFILFVLSNLNYRLESPVGRIPVGHSTDCRIDCRQIDKTTGSIGRFRVNRKAGKNYSFPPFSMGGCLTKQRRRPLFSFIAASASAGSHAGKIEKNRRHHLDFFDLLKKLVRELLS